MIIIDFYDRASNLVSPIQLDGSKLRAPVTLYSLFLSLCNSEPY